MTTTINEIIRPEWPHDCVSHLSILMILILQHLLINDAILHLDHLFGHLVHVLSRVFNLTDTVSHFVLNILFKV